MATLLVALTAVASTALIFARLEQALLDAEATDLERDTEVRATRWTTQVDEFVRDAKLLAGTPPILGLIRAERAGGVDPTDGSSADLWRTRLAVIFRATLLTKPAYLQARYVGFGDEGRELVRVERGAEWAPVRTAEAELQAKGHRGYVQRAADAAAWSVLLSRIDLNREHGRITDPHQPVLRVTVTIPDPEGRPFGALVLNLDMRSTLEAVTRGVQDGRVHFLVDSEGDYLQHPTPPRPSPSSSGAAARPSRTSPSWPRSRWVTRAPAGTPDSW